MRALKSITGAVFAALYAIAFVAAYADYRAHSDQWLADFVLIFFVASPFVWTMRFLSGGSFGMTGDNSLKVLAAALFCCALAWVVGSVLEWLARALFRLVRGRRSS